MPRAESHPRRSSKHLDQLTKDKIRWICDWEAHQGHNGFHNRVFASLGVSRSTGYRALREVPNPVPKVETRGRPTKVSDEDIYTIQETVKEHGWTSKSMNWDDLAREACNGELSGHTLRRAMGTFDHYRCINCKQGWLNAELAKARVDFAHAMLHEKPYPQDWHTTLFSGESSWVLNHLGSLQRARAPGERYCRQCLEHKEATSHKPDKERLYLWAAVGVPLSACTSQLVWYDSGNTSGKMTATCYIDQVLEPVVKPWISRMSFVLCEDVDASWTTGVNSPATRWRKENRLPFYYNAKASPDLSPVQSAFQAVEATIKLESAATSTKPAVYGAWGTLDPQSIVEAVDSMPTRLRTCIEAAGQYTHF